MNRPEIIVGLTGALGVDLEAVQDSCAAILKTIGYNVVSVRLSHLLKEYPEPGLFPKPDDELPEDERLNSYMNAGNEFCKSLNRSDAMALLAILKIRDERSKYDKDSSAKSPLYNHAFILRSLKRPEEVELLRKVYGSSFFLLSAYAPKSHRQSYLAKRFAHSKFQQRPDGMESKALELLERDEEESDNKFGQQVRETFWRADGYVDASEKTTLDTSIRRMIELFFGHPFHTPTKDEFMMFLAQAAAYRSASLGRQVGAVIATSDGSVLATGTNEVPKAGGGQYWSDDEMDARDHIEGFDSSDTMRKELLGDILLRLQKDGRFVSEKQGNVNSLIEELLYGDTPILKRAEFNALTEFQRPVHAEMSAITDAARRGVPVAGATLYSTTFPCHGCARHIIAAGLLRIVYIEPYAKSLARVLHSDSITIDDDCDNASKVRFVPFAGLAPRRYLDCFEMTKDSRKDKRGKALKWNPETAIPRIKGWGHTLSIYNEDEALIEYNAQLREPNAGA